MYRTIINELKTWKSRSKRKPLILSGARQVGKTYLLKDFGATFFTKCHYVNFEAESQARRIFESDLNPKRILQDLSFHLDTSIDTQNSLLILDEIQECSRALTSLKYFNEDFPEFAICAAGSLLGVGLNESSFPVGKVEFRTLNPMSFEEYLAACEDNRSVKILYNLNLNGRITDIVHAHLWQQLKRYFIIGGLPEVIATYLEYRDDLYTAFQKVRDNQQQLILSYLADMAKHSGKQNSMHLERLWRQIPMQLASEQDCSAPKFKFKGVVPGVHTYSRLAGAIDWLTAAGLIIKCPIVSKGLLPLSAYTRENFFKLYCFDVGLLGALSELPPKVILNYDYGSFKGYYAENFIAQEFRYSAGGEIYSWRENQAEIEFIRTVDSAIIPIEIKSGWVTQAKSLKVFCEKYSPPYRVIMSAHNLQIVENQGIHHYPMYLAYRFPLPG